MKQCIGLLAAGLLLNLLPLAAQTAGGSAAPTWYPDHSVAYPDDIFLAMQGEGPDAVSARTDALEQLARYFGVDIETLSTGTQLYRDSATRAGGQSQFERSVFSRVQTKSTQKLFAVETSQAWEPKPGRFVVLAWINRSAGLTAWDNLEKTALARLKTSLPRVANDQLPMGTRLANYRAAQALVAQIADYETKRRLLRGDAPALPPPELLAAWEGVKDSFLPRSQITIEIGGDEADDLAGRLADQLSKAGFLTGAGGSLVLHARSAIKDNPGGYGLASAQWKLDLSLSDGQLTAAALTLQGKSSGSSLAKAHEKLSADIQKQLEASFIPELINRLLKSLD
jgi:hypothetical protein